jgi:hypothetical protein
MILLLPVDALLTRAVLGRETYLLKSFISSWNKFSFFPQNRPWQCSQECYVTSFMEYIAGDLLPKKMTYEKLGNTIFNIIYNTHSNYWRAIYGRYASQGIPNRRSNKRLCITAFLKFYGALTPHYPYYSVYIILWIVTRK